MTLRIDVDELPDNVAEAIAAGDEVVVERDGKVVGVLAPRSEAKGGLPAMFEDLRAIPGLDEDWERDLAIVASEINRPPGLTAWER